MPNKKNILLYVLLSVLVAVQVVIVNLSIRLWLKIVISIVVYATVLCILILHTKKVLKASKVKAKVAAEPKMLKPVSDPSLLDIYAILKIAPQYNADGSLKDMYQLLGIEPEYDEHGNRISTIYEKLGINPKFNANGQEIPYVLRIKNRANSLIKLQAAPMPLVYLPRDKQIIGQKPILPVPILTEQKEQPPQFKQIPVVKPAKKPQAKPSKPAAVNYGSGARKVSVTGTPKVSYSAIKTVSESSAGINLFTIQQKKAEVVKPNIQAEEKKIPQPSIEQVNKPKVTSVVVTLQSQTLKTNNQSQRPQQIVVKPTKEQQIKKKDISFLEFTPINLNIDDNSNDIQRF